DPRRAPNDSTLIKHYSPLFLRNGLCTVRLGIVLRFSGLGVELAQVIRGDVVPAAVLKIDQGPVVVVYRYNAANNPGKASQLWTIRTHLNEVIGPLALKGFVADIVALHGGPSPWGNEKLVLLPVLLYLQSTGPIRLRGAQ